MVNINNINEDTMKSASYLVLEDGTVFKGHSFGYESDSEGEIGNFVNQL